MSNHAGESSHNAGNSAIRHVDLTQRRYGNRHPHLTLFQRRQLLLAVCRQPIEAEVEALGRVGEGPHADPINAGICDGSHGFERDATGGFQLDLRRDLVAEGNGGAEHVWPHVVEEDDIGTGGKHIIELIEAVDFDFDEHVLGHVLGIEFCQEFASPADGAGGRQILFGRQRQVVVFDQNRIEQAGAMVMAAAAADGVFFQSPPAGRCLSCVVNAGLRACDAADILTRKCGDAGKAAE